MANDLKILDCTLRDGGYINDWKWGYRTARDIIHTLVRANVDIVEVGFLRNVEGYDPDVTVCNTIEELNRLLPDDCGSSMFSGMAMRSNYDINKLSPYSGKGIEMIRITAHDYDIEEGMDFAREVKEKGYRLSINPINIMGYSDEQLLWIINQVNDIHPYQFSIVDTFGSMKRRDLDRIVSLVDHNMDRSIRVALHLHENMSLSFSLAQKFLDKHLGRSITVDGSLMGMGRIPGNLPIELIADYINEYFDKNYDIDFMLDAIQDHIAPMKGETEWGYTPAYFLSARFNLHRNYAEHYLGKGDLTNRDIDTILARIDNSKKTAFDREYADRLYEQFMNNIINDDGDRARLREELTGKNILLLAPGATVSTHRDDIMRCLDEEKPVVIAVNFIPNDYRCDYGFFSNNKRFSKIDSFPCKVIATSNLPAEKVDYHINYNHLSGSFEQGCNSLLMLLTLLREMDVSSIAIAGADGYVRGGTNYFSSDLRTYTEHGHNFNVAVTKAIRNMELPVIFITPSEYDTAEE